MLRCVVNSRQYNVQQPWNISNRQLNKKYAKESKTGIPQSRTGTNTYLAHYKLAHLREIECLGLSLIAWMSWVNWR
jgi:hypothetical protein